jgi:hypothetical protein
LSPVTSKGSAKLTPSGSPGSVGVTDEHAGAVGVVGLDAHPVPKRPAHDRRQIAVGAEGAARLRRQRQRGIRQRQQRELDLHLVARQRVQADARVGHELGLRILFTIGIHARLPL